MIERMKMYGNFFRLEISDFGLGLYVIFLFILFILFGNVFLNWNCFII